MDEPMMVTTVRVPARVWRLLRALAERRALDAGGRPSASAVIAELVQAETERQETERA